ncbi:MAG TPA: hypothetical protein VFN68_12485 [Acidimicrobiales bacterium]|nr:hypothetical protein [Acidimicrobiales bacterium]
MSTSLDESARLAGSHAWFERRMFEILGSWVASTPDPAVKLMLDRHSQHHAWRARQWWDRLPVLADVDRDALIEPAGAAVAAALARLQALAAPPAADPSPTDTAPAGTPAADTAPADTAAATSTVARLAGAYRFALPRLWASYEHHRALAGPVADGSTLRTLDIVASDAAADWRQGEALLQGLLADRETVAAAASAVRILEATIVGE